MLRFPKQNLFIQTVEIHQILQHLLDIPAPQARQKMDHDHPLCPSKEVAGGRGVVRGTGGGGHQGWGD